MVRIVIRTRGAYYLSLYYYGPISYSGRLSNGIVIFFLADGFGANGIATLRLSLAGSIMRQAPYNSYMGTDTPDEDGGRTDEKLTPKTAYRMTEEQGMTQSEVGDLFGVSQPRVSTLKKQYEEARHEGRQEAEPSDFEADELRSALGDEAPESNPFEGEECPLCGDTILADEAPDSPGIHDCPHCGKPIQWSEGELP